MNILQVSTFDVGGGAERVAWNLFDGYRARGHRSRLAVGRQQTSDPDVVQIPNAPTKLALWNRWRRRWARRRTMALGHEDFNYPGTWRLLDLPGGRPEILHCHNLHGRYFDLRALPHLSRQVPVMLTLHDAWTLSGHCAHSFDCDRWQTGCGQCPDLSSFPAVKRDATDFNWQKKKSIYEDCRLFVSAPSAWLMNKAADSMLAPAMYESRVIHNGVDQQVFYPGNKQLARQALNLPRDATILLFVANNAIHNPFKDYDTLQRAVSKLGTQPSSNKLLFLAIGEKARQEQHGHASTQYLGPIRDVEQMANFYRAADIYLHAAKADTFPNTIIEAMSCGTPVIGTAVSGIPEQIRPLARIGCDASDTSQPADVDRDAATGILVGKGDCEALAAAIELLIADRDMLRQIADNAALDAHQRFGLAQQVDAFLDWYDEILAGWQCRAA